MDQLKQRIARHRGSVADILEDFNELTRLSVSMWVFVTAGRGTKIQEIRNGSVLCSDELMLVDDKETEDERGARLLPSTFATDWILCGYAVALVSISSRIIGERTRHSHDVWSELSGGNVRFDAICFQCIEASEGKYSRSPAASSDVQAIAQRYFEQNKNFMRHVVITRWIAAGQDPTLLRILTGHAWEGAQVPAVCATYSPRSAILAVREPLEALLRIWVAVPAPSRRAKLTFLDWPLRRLHKCHQAFRSAIEEGRQGPKFARWHLAAEVICRVLRDQVLNQRDLSTPSRILLSIIVFDGIHESQDLTAILSSSESFQRSPYGWTMQWRRPSDPSHRVVQAQTATSMLLELRTKTEDWPPLSVIEDETNKFIATLFPASSEKGSTSSKTLDNCRAACALWLDLQMPSALQTAYSQVVSAPYLSVRSAMRLISGRDLVTPPGDVPRRSARPGDEHAQLKKLLQLVHHVGDTSKHLGEQKARARYYEEHVKSIESMPTGSITQVIHHAITGNIKLLECGASGRLRFSSISTYLSALTPALKQLADANLMDMDGEELSRLGQLMFKSANDKDSSDHARLGIQAAAAWFLKTLRQMGYPLASDDELQSQSTHSPQSRSQTIPIVDTHTLESVRTLIKGRALGQLEEERLLLAMDLMARTPLRWMEVATLNSSHLISTLPYIRIESSGFGHIKTAASTRTVKIDEDLMRRMRELVIRVERLRSHLRHPIIFGYADPTSDDSSISHWIHEELSHLARHVLGDDFRIHNLRANAVTESLFPGWALLFKRWTAANLTGQELDEFFRWTPAMSWRAETVSAVAGHSHPRSSVYYYLFAGLPLRSLYMAGINSRLHPPIEMLSALGISIDAYHKACQRDSAVAGNRWNHLARKLRKHRDPSQTPAVIDTTSDPDSQLLTTGTTESSFGRTSGLTAYRYMCLRATGLDARFASDESALRMIEQSVLEDRFRSYKSADLAQLRRREGKSAGDRSDKAEVELIRSSQFDDLYKLFSAADPGALKRLLQLLRPHLSAGVADLSVIEQAASVFHESNYELELIFGQRYLDVELRTRLSRIKSVRVGEPVRDLGQHPRAFLIARKTVISRVLKSRLRSISSLLLYLMCHEKSTKAPNQ